jgi:hypothetical protein
MSEHKHIYIIGAPRSGTTWLHSMLGLHPNVASLAELNIFRSYLRPVLNAWELEEKINSSGKWRMGLPLLFPVYERDKLFKDLLQAVYQKVADSKPGSTHILDKHPANTLEVPLIRQYYPDARFIHIIRDGREVARSLIRIHREMGAVFGSSTWDNACWQWNAYVGQGIAHRGQPWYMEVKYEDLQQNGPLLLKEIFDFCGLDSNTAISEQILSNSTVEKMQALSRDGAYFGDAHISRVKKRPLSALEAYRFHLVAGKLLQQLGYISHPEWWVTDPRQKVYIPIWHKVDLLMQKIRSLLN